MAITVSLNGVSYSIPQPGDSAWGQNVTNYLVATSTGLLSKAGGTFTLTGEVDFGATYGLRTVYYKSRGTNIATAGVLRLANDEGVVWRNAANDANLILKVNGSNLLEFNGTAIQPSGNYITALTGDVTATGPGSVVATISAGVIVNSMVDDAAAIARSKLGLGTANHVVINDGTGAFSSEAQLAVSRGGTGQDLSAATGVLRVDAGVVSAGEIVVSEIDAESSTAGFAILSNGDGTADWGEVTAPTDTTQVLSNVGFSASASAGAMTLTITQKDGSSAPSGGNPATVAHRSRTITNGGYSILSYTSTQSLVIPDTATLGFANGDDAKAYYYSIYDGTNLETAVSTQLLDESILYSTTAIGTGSDSNALYSTSARTDCSIRVLGFFQVNAITTAGTWTTPDLVAVNQGQELVEPEYIESVLASNSSYTTTGDTFVDAGISVTLTPGVWDLGYDLTLDVNAVTTSGSRWAGLTIRTGSNVVIEDMGSVALVSQSTTAALYVFPLSNSKRITVSETTTYKISYKAANANTAMEVRVRGENISGITGFDNASKIWARRVK